jgi:curved DNA-binding protein CbpA
LGISADASEKEIRSAYKEKVMKCHPDKPDGSKAEFTQVDRAYRVLIDKEKRRAYDLELRFQKDHDENTIFDLRNPETKSDFGTFAMHLYLWFGLSAVAITVRTRIEEERLQGEITLNKRIFFWFCFLFYFLFFSFLIVFSSSLFFSFFSIFLFFSFFEDNNAPRAGAPPAVSE